MTSLNTLNANLFNARNAVEEAGKALQAALDAGASRKELAPLRLRHMALEANVGRARYAIDAWYDRNDNTDRSDAEDREWDRALGAQHFRRAGF